MTINPILRRVVLAGIFIIPFIPFVVANSLFFPFITGKAFTFRVIVEIIFAAWAVLAITDTRYRPKRSWLVYGLGAFVVIIAAADMFGLNPFKSFWSNFERMEGLITLLHLAAYFLVASTVLNTEKLWNWFWNTSIVASLIVVIYGFLQLAGKITINQGGARLDATFGNATYLAVYVLFHIFITAFIVVSPQLFLLAPMTAKKDNKYYKTALGVVIIILLGIILYYTATRGALLGLIGGVGLAALLVAIFEKRRPKIRKAGMGLVIAAVVVVGGFLLIKDSNFVKSSPVLSRYSSISLNDPTTISRFLLWNMAFEGFKDRPILGWGQENFNYVFNEQYSPKLFGQEQWFDRTHNVIFDWLIAGGILGLASYLFFYGAIVWYIWKKKKEKHNSFSVTEKSILTGLMLAYFIHNLFVFDNLISYILFFTVAAYVYARTTLWDAHHAEHKESPYKNNQYVAPVAAVALVIVLYFANYIPLKSNQALIAAIRPQSAGLNQNIALFKQAIAYNSVATQEAREQLISMAGQFASQQITDPIVAKNATELIALAVAEMKNQVAETPRDARPYVLAGSFLNLSGRYPEAIELLSKAVELSPNKQTLLFELGTSYLGSEDYAKALPIFKKAFELEPKYEEARMLYAAAAVYAKDNTLAQELLKPVPAETVLNDDRLLRAYYYSNQHQKVLSVWKERLAKDPENPQLHLSLAAAYLLVNDRKNAIAEIEKIIKLDPTFKEQGDYYIKEIKAGRNP